MEQIRDPELIRQRMQHSLFRDKIRDFSFADIDDPGKQQQVVTDLLNFLAKWLYHHILGSDIMIGKLPPLEEWMIRDNPCEFTDDYLTGIDDLPRENVLRFEFNDGSWAAVRPSGTEPKLKLYFSVRGEDRRNAEQRQKAIRNVLFVVIDKIKV